MADSRIKKADWERMRDVDDALTSEQMAEYLAFQEGENLLGPRTPQQLQEWFDAEGLDYIESLPD